MPINLPNTIGRSLDRLSPTQAILFGYGFLVPLSVVDYTSSLAASFSVFYLIPVLVVGWCSSPRAAIIISLVSAALWELINRIGIGMSISEGIHLWNLGTRIFFYLLVTYLLAGLRSSRRSLSILSSVDSLTGVRNRRAFLEDLNTELARHQRSGQPLSLAYLDLDNFKQVNDTMGHQKGDLVLRTVANALVQTIRRTDILGRLGGDEFAVLMPETKGVGALAALSAARNKTVETMAGLGLPVSFSLGVVTVLGEASADQLLHEADALMYEVKRNGGNEVRQHDFEGKQPTRSLTSAAR